MLITRLKQQADICRVVTRIHTIRETSFIRTGHMIGYMTTACMTAGPVPAKIDPLCGFLLFVHLSTFVPAFLTRSIRDLDNPFGHCESASVEDVSLKALIDALARMKAHFGTPVAANVWPVLPSPRGHRRHCCAASGIVKPPVNRGQHDEG